MICAGKSEWQIKKEYINSAQKYHFRYVNLAHSTQNCSAPAQPQRIFVVSLEFFGTVCLSVCESFWCATSKLLLCIRVGTFRMSYIVVATAEVLFTNTYWKRQTKEELTEFFVFIHSVWVRMCHFWSLSLRASFSFLLCCVRFALVSVYSICIKQLYQITLQPGSVTLDWSSFRQKFSQLIRCFVSVKVFYSVFKTFLDNLRFLLAIVFFSCCLQYKILVQQIKSKTKTVFSQPHRGSEYFSGKQRTIIVFYSVLNQTG